MRRADQVTGLIVLLFSLAVMEGSRRMPPSGTFGPGAGFLPFWLGASLAFFAILLIVQAARRPVTGPGPGLFPRGSALLAVAAAVAGLGGYILLLERLGFLLATALLSAFLLGVVERERWTVTMVVAVLNALALYVIFQKLLGVNLPKSLLGF